MTQGVYNAANEASKSIRISSGILLASGIFVGAGGILTLDHLAEGKYGRAALTAAVAVGYSLIAKMCRKDIKRESSRLEEMANKEE